MTQPQVDKRVQFLQYFNTGALTIILGLATMIASMVTNIKNDQTNLSIELSRIKTIQDINTSNIQNLDKRVSSLEITNMDIIKTWVDANYVRKAQK